MLAAPEVVAVVAAAIDRYAMQRVVLDPVMVSATGARLIEPPAVEALVQSLFPRVQLITPNLDEAALLLGQPVARAADMLPAAQGLQALGAPAVLMKGGHLAADGAGAAVDDLLLLPSGQALWLQHPRIATRNLHGAGCTLSSAIAANLAKGLTVAAAVVEAKRYITVAIEHALSIGKGVGPTHHFYELYQKAGLSDE